MDSIFLIFLDFSVIKTRKVKEVMTETDRKHYCPKTPYVDAPQSIGNGVTISAPHMVTFFLFAQIQTENLIFISINLRRILACLCFGVTDRKIQIWR